MVPLGATPASFLHNAAHHAGSLNVALIGAL